MRLTKVTIWNYRSYWSEGTEGGQEEAPSATLELAPGVNYLVGPNNVGKSNLVRAIALALDPNARYEQALDRPQSKSWGPAIELEFTTGPEPSAAVKKLLQDVDAYERTIEGFAEPSLASQGKLCFYVGYWKGSWRDERFLTRTTRDSGKVRGPNNKRLKAVERFYELVRFVDIRSGEDLQNLLQRGFKEILTSAMSAELAKEMSAASLLEKAEEVPDKAKLVLLVEGETDAQYLQLAAHKLAISINDIHIVFWTKRGANELIRGAGYAAVQAVTLSARHAPARVVVALFDTDEDGKRGYEMLTKSFGWKNKKPDEGLFALTYEQWLPGYNIPVEAEDIFENATIDAFLAEPGNKAFCTGTKLREKAQRWHYDLSPSGKIAFVKWLEQNGTAAMFEPWRPGLGHLRKLIADAATKTK